MSDVLSPMFDNPQVEGPERHGAAHVPKATKKVEDNCGCSHEQVTRKPLKGKQF